MVQYIELTVDEMLLDEENPRLGSANSQSEALQRLIELNPTHFRTMMQSISENGLDPGDSFYVIARNDDYIVLEGNRRLSALKVLTMPELLEGTTISASVKKSLLAVARRFNKDDFGSARCVLFNGREAANDWIYRRHTGSANGEGRIDWGPLEQQRFSGDQSILDVVGFLKRNGGYDEKQWAETEEAIRRKSTNLSRLLESAYGRRHLGLTLEQVDDKKIPAISSDPAWALAVLKRLVDDVRVGVIDSRVLNRASDIESYFKGLPENLQPLADKSFRPRALRSISVGDSADMSAKVTPAKIARPKRTISRRPRVSLAPGSHPFRTPTSEKGNRLLREASKLDADKFTLSCAFLLRAFVELAVEEYMARNGIPKGEEKDGKPRELFAAEKAERVVKHIRANSVVSDDNIRHFEKTLVTRTSPTSIQSLNAFVHAKFAIPTPDALRSGWDASVPLFIAAFGAA